MHIVLLLTLLIIDFIFNNLHIKNGRKYKMFLMGLSLFLFAALRGEYVGTDIPGYFYDYNIDASLNLDEIFTVRQGRDPVFHICLNILSYISNSPHIMLVTIGGIVAYSFSKFVYYQKGDALLIYIMFICLRIFPFTLSGLRQAVAMSICWLAFLALQNDKVKRFILLVLGASLFHITALSFLLALPICKIKKEKYFFILVSVFLGAYIILGNAIFTFISEVVFLGRFNNYVTRADLSTSSFGMTNLLIILFWVCSYFFYKKNNYYDLSSYLRLSLIAIVLFFIGESFPNMFRIAYYYIVLLFPLFTEILKRVMMGSTYLFVKYILFIMLFLQYIILGSGAGTDLYTFLWE